jgi:mersacidin/lichenicidin family type 2 lantibiotic
VGSGKLPTTWIEKEEKVMAKFDVVRAWKDEVYRAGLSPEQRAALPANPAGAIELQDSQLNEVRAWYPSAAMSLRTRHRRQTCR